MVSIKKVIALITVIIMAGSLVLTGCGQKDDGYIRIGLITPKTGNVAQYGIAVENAVRLAVKQYNEKGGILGKEIRLISYDNKGDATESVNVFKRLSNQDKIHVLVGPVISSTSLAVAPLAEKAKITMITPTATNDKVTPDFEYVFRACYTDPYQGGTVGLFAAQNLNAKKAAVLFNTGDDYSTGLAEAFRDTFIANGGTVTNYEGYTKDDKDFKVVLTNIKAQNPDVLFVPDYYNQVGLIAGQVKDVGLDVVMLGGDGWDDVQKEHADNVEGYYFANHYATDDEAAVVQDFIAAYEAEYGETPNALGALGYDAAVIAIEAIIKAGSTDKAAILKAVKETDLDMVTGHIKFDQDGNPIKSISMIKIVSGQLLLDSKVSND